MIHADFDLKKAQASALTVTARRTITGLAFLAIGATLTVTVACTWAIWAATAGLEGNRVAAFATASLVAALVLTIAAATMLGRVLAVPASRAADLLMSYLVMAGEDPVTDIALHNRRWMSLPAIMGDFERLEARVTNVVTRSQGIIAELERAREHANLQNLAKSQFLANMSHELRTPLNAILGYAMLLTEDAMEADNKPVIADLDRIQQAGRHLLSLINEILDLSKIEAGKATLERTVVDVNGLVRSVAIAFDDPAKRNGNMFDVGIAREVGIMIGDEGKIRQCLNNLLNNAFKFTADGHIALDVDLIERRPIKTGDQQLRLISKRQPAFAGVDPYNKYIDRNSDDNLIAVAAP